MDSDEDAEDESTEEESDEAWSQTP
jgi:hypothetical protein